MNHLRKIVEGLPDVAKDEFFERLKRAMLCRGGSGLMATSMEKYLCEAADVLARNGYEVEQYT